MWEWDRRNELLGMDPHLACKNVLLEEVVQKEVSQVRVLVKCLLDVAKETTRK